MGVIQNELRRDDNARVLFERALAAEPGYIPAMYNLGLLHEEFGDQEKALQLFSEILELNPAYHDALIRIAHAQTFADPGDGRQGNSAARSAQRMDRAAREACIALARPG